MVEALQTAVPRLHSIDWAIEQLNLGRSKVFELIATGQLRSVKVGRRRLIPESAIADFIAALESGGADAS